MLSRINTLLGALSNLSKTERQVHLLLWLAGFVVINWPQNGITVGIFKNTHNELLLPTIYGTLLNVIVVYYSIASVYTNKGPLTLKIILHTSLVMITISIVESLLDCCLVAFRLEKVTSGLMIEIATGNFIMNFMFFYIPALIYSIIKGAFQKTSSIVEKDILIQNGHQKVFVHANQLTHLESDGNYVKYYLEKEVILERSSLSKVAEKLPDQFIRCHKSFIVNSSLIQKMTASELQVGSFTIPIGRIYKENLEILTKNKF